MTDRRYPLATLVADMGVTSNEARLDLGVSGSSWTRMAEQGLTEVQADRLAARAGLVDIYVWPEIVDHRIDDARARRSESQRRYRQSNPAYAERQRQVRREYYIKNGGYERSRARAAYWADPDAQRERQRRARAEKASA